MELSSLSPEQRTDLERATELGEALDNTRERIQRVAAASSGFFEKIASGRATPADIPVPRLVAVSKLKPASDILACYEIGQLDFGENYVQELQEKAEQLPKDIRWHFIGTLQSNKCKILAAIPNLYAIQTLNSIKTADALNRARDEQHKLNVLIQVNTSGEDAKSGLPPLSADKDPSSIKEVAELAQHVIANCPRLHLQGLMTIGSLSESLSGEENKDFHSLAQTRDALQQVLEEKFLAETDKDWGQDGRLLLSMGMSSDFEEAIRAGSDIVRVGTSIFGSRPKKGA